MLVLIIFVGIIQIVLESLDTACSNSVGWISIHISAHQHTVEPIAESTDVKCIATWFCGIRFGKVSKAIISQFSQVRPIGSIARSSEKVGSTGKHRTAVVSDGRTYAIAQFGTRPIAFAINGDIFYVRRIITAHHVVVHSIGSQQILLLPIINGFGKTQIIVGLFLRAQLAAVIGSHITVGHFVWLAFVNFMKPHQRADNGTVATRVLGEIPGAPCDASQRIALFIKSAIPTVEHVFHQVFRLFQITLLTSDMIGFQ